MGARDMPLMHFMQRLRRTRVARAIACALVVATLAAPLQAQLPTLNDDSDMSLSDERRLGDRIARELYRDPDFIEDAVIEEHVDGIWQGLRKAARQRGEMPVELDERFAWRVLLGKDRTINAFALPGGYFGLHLGLVGIVESPDELASVMSHEISHVTQRHISRMLTQQSRQAPWLLGALILGVLAASKSPDAANALITGGQALAVQSRLNFSRDMEREADRIGFGVMTQAGFSPQGFVGLFQKLQNASRINDNGSYPYLRSHPLTTQRIADMQSRIPSGAAPTQVQVTVAPALVSARARVLSGPGVDVLAAWADDAHAPAGVQRTAAQKAAGLYAASLSAAKLRELPRARKLATELQAFVADDPPARRLAALLSAELALAAGDAAGALSALGGKPTARPEVLLTAQARLALGQAAEAVAPLQAVVTSNPLDSAAWRLLGSAYQQQNRGLRALRAEAESHAARLDYAAAIDRFKAGQALARAEGRNFDYVDASVIDTRLREVSRLLAEQLAEK